MHSVPSDLGLHCLSNTLLGGGRGSRLKLVNNLSLSEFELEFHSPVKSVKVMLRQSVNLFTIFLGRLNPLGG